MKLKKTATILIAFLLAVIFATAAAAAQDNTCGEYLTWSFDEATGTLTISGTGAMYDYYQDDNNQDETVKITTAPWGSLWQKMKHIVIEEGVTSVGHCAFTLCSNVESVSLPSTLLSIGNLAFYGLQNLEEITVPKSVTSMGDTTFSFCVNLKSAIIEAEITEFPYAAFEGCISLETVQLPQTLEKIGFSAFHYCALKQIDIPDSVNTIEGWAFNNNPDLEELILPASLTKIDGDTIEILPIKKLFIPASVETIEYTDSLLFRCEEFVVDEKNGNYKSIDGVLFTKDGKNLLKYPIGNERKVYQIPEGTEKLALGCFQYAELDKLVIPASMTVIEDDIINSNIKQIENHSASVSALTSIVGGPVPGIDEVTVWADFSNTIAKTYLKFSQLMYRAEDKVQRDYYRLIWTDEAETFDENAERVKAENEIFGTNFDSEKELFAHVSDAMIYVPVEFICPADSAQHTACIEMGLSHLILGSDFDCECGKHDVYENEYIAPDCTHNGYRGGTICLQCEKVFAQPEIVPMLGHAPVTDAAIDPTCTSTGLTEGSHCSRCGATLQKQIRLEMLSHHDDNGDGYCDGCGTKVGEEIKLSFFEQIKEFFTSFFDKIVAIFRRLFG